MLSYLLTMVRAREHGQSMAEYALILALIAVVCIAAVTGLGAAIVTKLNAVTTGL